jgi:hypothetical protein
MKIEPDKRKHFLVGIPLGAVLQGIVLLLFPGQFVPEIILAVLVLAIICYGFEVFSKISGKGHYDFIDAVAGLLGGIVGMSLVLIVLSIVH